MNYILLEEVDSTNSYVAVHADELEDMTLVAAVTQTAGRGQRGNSWESEPGANITATMLHRPADIPAREQFAVSEAVALAVADTLRFYGIEAKVKWPNDIYVDDRKISGILIECSIMGSALTNVRIGIGLNVNQREFRSDAPNPVSMVNILDRETPIEGVVARLSNALGLRLQSVATPEGRSKTHTEYLTHLWRGDGNAYPYRVRETGTEISAIIRDVRPEGYLILEDTADGAQTSYAFKEVEAIVSMREAIKSV